MTKVGSSSDTIFMLQEVEGGVPPISPVYDPELGSLAIINHLELALVAMRAGRCENEVCVTYRLRRGGLGSIHRSCLLL